MTDHADHKVPDTHTQWLPLLDDNLPESERRRLLGRLENSDEAPSDIKESLDIKRLLDFFSIAGRDYCPSREDLLAAVQRQMHDGFERQRIERHSQACPLCADDLADFQALSEPSLIEVVVRMGQKAVELVKNSFGEILEAQPVPAFRSDGGTSTAGHLDLKRSLGDATLELQMRRSSDTQTLLSVQLKRQQQRCDFTTLLFQDGQVVDGRSATDGRVSIEGLEAGVYELVVRERPAAEALTDKHAGALEESVVIELQ